MKANLLSSVSKCCVTHPWRPPLPPGIHVSSGNAGIWVTYYYKGKYGRSRCDQWGQFKIPYIEVDMSQTQTITVTP